MKSLARIPVVLVVMIGFISNRSFAIDPATIRNDDSVSSKSFAEGLYTFKADNAELEKALNFFARSNGLRLSIQTQVQGRITASFTDKSLDEALKILLAKTDYQWSLMGDELFIFRPSETPMFDQMATSPDSIPKPLPLQVVDIGSEKIFKINYPRLKRNGTGTSAATISSTASGQAGTIQLTTTDELIFWQEIEEQLKVFASSGRLVINRTAGIIHVKDTKENLESIQHYLEAVIPAATRQVEIVARIYEITLNDDRSLGVDWSAVDNNLNVINKFASGQGTTQLIKPGSSLKSPTINLSFTLGGDLLQATVAALKEQGKVRVVSQPRIITLNNQPALIKVGTDLPFFSSTVTINPTTNQKEVTEEVHVITVGVVLSVTPQIAEDGWVTLGIDPLISDLVTTLTSANGSTAPVVDVKQSSSLIRLRNGQSARLSGLVQSKESTTKRKIPLLGDLPVAGSIFRWEYKHIERKELVIFISPRIL